VLHQTKIIKEQSTSILKLHKQWLNTVIWYCNKNIDIKFSVHDVFLE